MTKLIFILVIIFGVIYFKNDLSPKAPPMSTTKKETISIVAAGDISCNEAKNEGECKDTETAQIVSSLNPSAVIALGDLQYNSGSYKDFITFYDKSWGKFKDKTYPTPGNHEYETTRAQGYFDYFQKPSYYSFSLGNWFVISLDSNCWASGCDQNSKQYEWLKNTLDQNHSQCTIAFWHHPLVSSGQHGNNNITREFWNTLVEQKTDIVLWGHDHLYERFDNLGTDGFPSKNGIRAFTVGTGGRNLYQFKEIKPGSKFRNNDSYGALQIKLHDNSYDWSFINTNKEILDQGSAECN